jgi:hypothetical protein
MRVAYCSNLDPAWRSEIARPSRNPPRVPTAASMIVENNVKRILWLAFFIDKFTYYSCRATHKQATVPLSHGESTPKEAITAFLGKETLAFDQFRPSACSPFLLIVIELSILLCDSYRRSLVSIAPLRHARPC